MSCVWTCGLPPVGLQLMPWCQQTVGVATDSPGRGSEGSMSEHGNGCHSQIQLEKWVWWSRPPDDDVCSLQDGLVLNHWRREADEGKPYAYAKFNKSLDIPSYSDEEYKVQTSKLVA